MAPTSNPIRRQYAAIIANSWESVGINVNLIYVSFGVLASRLFPTACPCTPSYDGGGFDIAFIGHGGGPTYPDFRGTTEYHSETGPPANNYPTYKNTTVDALIDNYQTNFNVTARTQLANTIIKMVDQDKPLAVVYYLADQFVFKNEISPWKQQSSYTSSELPDFEHWATTGGVTQANLGETGDITSVNYAQSANTYTQYNIWLYGATLSGLQALNPFNLQYPNALANNIVSSADGKTYTISFKPNLWSDGVAVTADDFLFWMMSSLNGQGNSVNIGGYQAPLGLGTKFTLLNGTNRYTWNGTYYKDLASATAGGFQQTSTYQSLNSTAFTFTTSVAFVFTNPVLTGITPLPMHVLEQIPEANWDTVFGSISDNAPKTVTWNTARYGGNGSYHWAYNDLVGNGPYLWHGYNPTAQTGTLVKNPLFWNKTGLESAGYFSITKATVTHIVDKSGALAAFATGDVNALDTNYQFTTNDIATIQSAGGYKTINSGPGSGSQEMGFNMGMPIWGTGTGTPKGQTDPANAARYGRDVRHALSSLIPRQLIINNLLSGAGLPGITEVSPAFHLGGVTSDPYDPSAATALLADAGYAVPSGSYVPINPPPITPVLVGGVTVTPPQFLVGQAVTFQGLFSVNIAAGVAGNGFAAILQQSTDDLTSTPAANQTWTPVALFSTSSGGGYTFTWSLNQPGSVSYRVFLTGIPQTKITSDALTDPVKIQADLRVAIARHQPLNTTSTAYSPVSTFKVGTLSDLITALTSGVSAGFNQLSTGITANLNQLQTNLAGQINNLGTSVNTLQTNSASKSDVASLNSQVATLTTIAYGALAIAVILGLVAIALAMRKRS